MSNASLCDNWWQLELQMAVQTAVARRTNSLLFVFLEPLEGRLVTHQLRRILSTYTCKRWYPDDLDKQQELWRHLKLAMKFPKRNGLAMERRTLETMRIHSRFRYNIELRYSLIQILIMYQYISLCNFPCLSTIEQGFFLLNSA